MEMICRTCLSSNRSSFNIFEHTFNKTPILDMLIECVAVKAEIDDGFPQTICYICLAKLVSATDFKLLVKKCDLKLRKLYKDDIRTNNIEVVEESGLSFENFPVIKNEVNVTQVLREFSHSDSNVIGCVKNELMLNENIRIDTSSQNDSSIGIHNIPNNADHKNDHNQQAVLKKEIVFDDTEILIQKDEYESDLSVITMKNFKNIVATTHQHVGIIENNKKLISHRDNIELQPFDASHHENEEISLSTSLTTIKDKHQINVLQNNLQEESSSANLNISSLNERKTGLSNKKRNQKQIKCMYCNKLLSYEYYINSHIHEHTGNTPYKCEICGKRYAKEYILNKHKRYHSNNKPFLCSICGKGFIARSNLQTHMETHSKERLHKCDICNKSFKQRNSLITHLKIHSGRNQDICEICGKSFRSVSGLYKHREIHNIEKPINCPTCGKSFVTKISLQCHMKRHSNDKPYACSKCEKRFSVKRSLESHILIHTGQKPYSCNICGKAFRQKACISRHMRIHTGETPFACALCPLKFKYKHHLLNHVRAHA